MPESILEAITVGLIKLLDQIYSPVFRLETVDPLGKLGIHSAKKPLLWTPAGTVHPDSYWLVLRGATVSRKLSDKVLTHCHKFVVNTQMKIADNEKIAFEVDDMIEIVMQFAQCQISVRGIEVKGEVYPYEDPTMLRKVLEAFHHHVIASVLTTGWALIKIISEDAAAADVIKVLDCRYIRCCLYNGLGYQNASQRCQPA